MTLLMDRIQPAYIELDALERAILETLAYFDIFDYPLLPDELRRYLHRLPASGASVERGLGSNALKDRIEMADGYVHLAGRGSLRALREKRRLRHKALATHIRRYGRALGSLPFMRMVALTGSSSMQNGAEGADLDFLLVTAPDRLWMARAFAILMGRWTALRGHILCPNVIISERALTWTQQDIYAAHELTQIVPLAGKQTYLRLRELNAWTTALLPNALGAATTPSSSDKANDMKRGLESVLNGGLGRSIENWEMRRKIARLTVQGAAGAETAFTADVCQGNFDQHGRRTREAFQERLIELGLDPAPALPVAVAGSARGS